MDNSKFKQCPCCSKWFSYDEIVNGSDVDPIGMCFLEGDFKNNVYYFNHTCDECNSTFVIPVMTFLPFIKETIPDDVLTGSECCEQHCIKIDDLMECNQECTYAPFRRFLINLVSEKKKSTVKASS